MKFSLDYSSRFRILKGGKIALVVSAVVASASLLQAAPSGGVVTSGSASITHSGTLTTITQSTQKAAINWTDFSIKANETVNFVQPNANAIALNRVVGNERSVIDGALNANGQVWLLNSNGVLFGKNASINTAGLLATTSSLSDADFNAGNYTFSGASNNAILNLGTITISSEGYAILSGKEVQNQGSIHALRGDVHLVGADTVSINLNGNSLLNLTVNKGVLDALVKNSGSIQADGGEVYLTTNAVDELLKGVVNNTGIIEAKSLEDAKGKIVLFAHGGSAHVDGTLDASGGFIETSGKSLHVEDSTIIKTKTWLIDPDNIIIESSGGAVGGESVSATAIQNALSTADIELQAVYDITVNEAITWATATQLKLTAGDEIYVNATIENTNTTNGGVYFNAPNTTDKVIFDANGKVIIHNVYQLQWMNQAVQGKYALGSNIDASATSSWDSGAGFVPIGTNANRFIGNFNGNNHTIDSLFISRPSTGDVGLFGQTNGATVQNVGLVNANITGNNLTGGLVGLANFGTTITNAYATGSVTGISIVGGLVGGTNGSAITNSYAKVDVIGSGYEVGGLVGGAYEASSIANSYATGSVTGITYVGGLVGMLRQSSTITNSYAIGSVTGTSLARGLVGGADFGTVATNSYWDTQTSGKTTSARGVGKTTEEMMDASTYASWDTTIWSFVDGSTIAGYALGGLPYLTNVTRAQDIVVSSETLFEGGMGVNGNPYTITNWTQLQNINHNTNVLTNGYFFALSNNLNSTTADYTALASATANSGAGFMSIGTWANQFSGNFNGNNHTIDSLFISRPSTDDVGLFRVIGAGGAVSNLGLTNATITGQHYVGGLAGWNGGTITNAYATGVVSGINNVGGLAGRNSGTITNAYATGVVNGNNAVGGLVGHNGGSISNAYATGGVNGINDHVGGLVGHNGGTITNAYATGGVSGFGYVGGLVGWNDGGIITASYWDKQTTEQENGLGEGSVSGAVGLTTAEFANSTNFTGWTAPIWSFGGGDGVEGYEVALRPYLTFVTAIPDKPAHSILFNSGWGTVASPYTLTNWTQLQNINHNTATLSKYYTLSNNLNSTTADYTALASTTANSGAGWLPIGTWANPFSGNFNGNNHTIDSLVISRPSTDFVGLFGVIGVGGTVSNLGVANATITGQHYVGVLAGYNYGTISNAYATGMVSGTNAVGGLAGSNTGSISNAYATGMVNGNDNVGGLVGGNSGSITNAYATGVVTGNNRVGGLVGYNGGIITNAYATGVVTGISSVGGLVGYNSGTITNAYATGLVTGTTNVGGFVGYNTAGGVITNSFWDKDTSGQPTDGVGTEELGGTSLTLSGKTTTEMMDASTYASWDTTIWSFVDGSTIAGYALGGLPYLTNVTRAQDIVVSSETLFEGGMGVNGNPYTITNWTQLQNINHNTNVLTSGYYFALSNNLDSATTGYTTLASASANSGAGFVPIGNNTNRFSGTFDGVGHTIDGLFIYRLSTYYVGLFGYTTSSTISNLGLTHADITAQSYVGGLVGVNGGTITNSYATGDVLGNDSVGGLVGFNGGTITNAYATGSVPSTGTNVGGFVGSNYGTITNAYATGSAPSTGTNVGGFVGENGGTITASFWDTTSSGTTTGVGAGTSTGVTGKTTAQMKDSATFAAWSILEDDTLKQNYPTLRMASSGEVWVIGTKSGEPTPTPTPPAPDVSHIQNGTASLVSTAFVQQMQQSPQAPAPVVGVSGPLPSWGNGNIAIINGGVRLPDYVDQEETR